MTLSRRHLIAGAGASSVLVAAADAAHAAPLTSASGRDATQLGVKPNSPDDQTRALQRAIDAAASARVPLALPPGLYRTGTLTLPDGAQLVGVRGATRFVFTGGASLFESAGADHLGLDGLTLDGSGIPLPQRRGLVHLLAARHLRITDCEIADSGGSAVWLEKSGGIISGNTLTRIALTGIVSFDAARLAITQNVIIDTNNNGIEILRTSIGDDGTLVTGNRISDCDFSAVRGNAASNIQITGNSVSEVREVALYAEFAFQGAVIANNTVDGAALGVSVCNFNEGGRLCSVSGNVIRNLKSKRPAGTDPRDIAGVGIYVEADSAVSGNVVEKAPQFGIVAGWGKYMRDVAITGNVVRDCFIGIGITVAPGAGTAMLSGNMMSATPRGAVVGLDHATPVTSDLLLENAPRFPQIALSGNAGR